MIEISKIEKKICVLNPKMNQYLTYYIHYFKKNFRLINIRLLKRKYNIKIL